MENSFIWNNRVLLKHDQFYIVYIIAIVNVKHDPTLNSQQTSIFRHGYGLYSVFWRKFTCRSVVFMAFNQDDHKSHWI